jgi:hypothetical protein
MSKFLESNGWGEVNALEDVEAKDKVFTHPPWLVSPAYNISQTELTQTRLAMDFEGVPFGTSSLMQRPSKPSPSSCMPKSSALFGRVL